MAKLDWAKARTRDQSRAAKHSSSNPAHREAAMAAFAEKHQIACFSCHDHSPIAWAKTGVSTRGPWAICLDCAKHQTSG